MKLLKVVPPYTIAIDLSEWKLGKAPVTVLMLPVSCRQISILLFWTVLETKGFCNDAEKQAIVEQFLQEYSVDSMRFVSADREFASTE